MTIKETAVCTRIFRIATFRISFFIFLTFITLPHLYAQETGQQPSKNAKDYYYSAKTLDQRGKYDEAIAEVKRALELDPSFSKAHLMLGVCYSKKHICGLAIKEYKQAIMLGMDTGNLAVAHHDLGAEYQNSIMSKEAEQEFKTALKLDPNFSEPKAALRKMKFMKFAPIIAFFLICIVLPVLIGLAIAGIMRLSRESNKNLKETASSLGTKCNLFGRYVVDRNGIKYWYSYAPPGRSSPAVFKVSMPCESHGEFTVAHESGFDKMAKKFGFSSELQTGDKDFDETYYILSDTMDFAQIYFQSAQRRETIKNLNLTGFTQIAHNGKIIEATWTGFDQSNLNASLVTETAEKLKQLSENLPDYFTDQEIFGIPTRRIKTILFYVFSSLALTTAVVTWFWSFTYPPLDSFNIFMRSLIFSIPAIISYLIVAGLAIRGRAAAHKDFIKIAAITIGAFLFLSNNALVLVNGQKDLGKPTTYTVAVVNKYLTRGKNSTTYHVVVQSWRPRRTMEEFTVGEDIYDHIREQSSSAIVTTKPGALGFEWVVSKRYK